MLILIFVAEDVRENTRKQRLLALYLHDTIYCVGHKVIADFVITAESQIPQSLSCQHNNWTHRYTRLAKRKSGCVTLSANSYTLFEVRPDGIADFGTNAHSGSVVELCDRRGRQRTHIAEEVIQLSRSCAIVCLGRQSHCWRCYWN